MSHLWPFQRGSEALRELARLLEEAQKAERDRRASDFSTEGFAVFWLLNQDEIAEAEQIGREMETAFEEHPHWRHSPDQQRDVRKALYKSLVPRVGVQRSTALVEKLLSVLSRSSR